MISKLLAKKTAPLFHTENGSSTETRTLTLFHKLEIYFSPVLFKILKFCSKIWLCVELLAALFRKVFFFDWCAKWIDWIVAGDWNKIWSANFHLKKISNRWKDWLSNRLRQLAIFKLNRWQFKIGFQGFQMTKSIQFAIRRPIPTLINWHCQKMMDFDPFSI